MWSSPAQRSPVGGMTARPSPGSWSPGVVAPSTSRRSWPSGPRRIGLAGEGDDHTVRDLQVDGALFTEAGDGAVETTGRHDRGAEGRASSASPGPGPAPASAPARGARSSRTARAMRTNGKYCVTTGVPLYRGRCSAVGASPVAGPARVRRWWRPSGRPGATERDAHGRGRTSCAPAARSLCVEQGLCGRTRCVAGSVVTRPSRIPPGGTGRPRCRQAASVATRPRGVRASRPARTRKGSHTSSTVCGSSPTATARVATPTGPPPNRRTSASSTARSSRSRPEDVDVVERERGLRDLPGHPPVGLDLGEVAHPAQQPVGDPRCAARAAGDLGRAVVGELDAEQVRRCGASTSCSSAGS